MRPSSPAPGRQTRRCELSRGSSELTRCAGRRDVAHNNVFPSRSPQGPPCCRRRKLGAQLRGRQDQGQPPLLRHAVLAAATRCDTALIARGANAVQLATRADRLTPAAQPRRSAICTEGWGDAKVATERRFPDDPIGFLRDQLRSLRPSAVHDGAGPPPFGSSTPLTPTPAPAHQRRQRAWDPTVDAPGQPHAAGVRQRPGQDRRRGEDARPAGDRVCRGHPLGLSKTSCRVPWPSESAAVRSSGGPRAA